MKRLGILLAFLIAATPAAAMLTVNQLTGFGAGEGKGPFTLTFIGRTDDTSNASSYSFAGVSIGTPKSDRLVIVTATGRDDGAGNPVLSSPTIAGVSATVAKANILNDGNNLVTIFYAVVPSGATGTIAFNLNVTAERMAIAVHTLTGYQSAVPTDSDSVEQSGLTQTTAVTVQAGGCIIGGVISNDQTEGGFTTVGLTEDFDADLETVRVAGGSATFATTQTPTLSFTQSGTTTATWAAWR